MKIKKLLVAMALLGISLVASVASSTNVRPCDTSCPTVDGFCNCPLWTDKPKKSTTCVGWNHVSAGGCWYE